MRRQQASPGRKLLYLPVAVLVLALIGYVAIVFVSRTASSNLLASAEVAVVDASGAPIPRIPVVAEWHELPFHRGRSLGVTDAGGRVPLGELADEWAMFGEFELHVLLVGSTQQTFRLEPRTRIELPEIGALRLRLVDEHGEPVAAPLGSAMAYLGGPGRAGSAQFGSDGVATFERVACNSDMHLDVRLHSFTPQLPNGDASPQSGDGRTIELVVPSQTPRIAGRVVDANGDAIQSSFRMDLQSGGTTLVGPSITTNADGAFVYLLDELEGSGTLTLSHLALGKAVVQLYEGDGAIRDLGTIPFPAQ